MSYWGMDFGEQDGERFPLVKAARSQYWMEVEIPLADIPDQMLLLLMGEDYYANMYRQPEADARWEDDGGAYL